MRSMKIIALLPFKNEEWCLPTYLHNTLKVVDDIIAIDDGSTDNSVKILEDAGVTVYSSEKLRNYKSGWSEGSIRAELLKLGREAGGTHFLCLDADESVSNTFVTLFDQIVAQMNPGDKISMQWLALWKSYTQYRDDQTVWSNNWKDFFFMDRPDLKYNSKQHMHLGRTPVGPNEICQSNWLQLRSEHGTVLHYQFSAYNNFQLKQAWFRCSELIESPGTEAAINSKYSITLLDDNVKLTEMPEEWYIDIPTPKVVNFDPDWKEENFVRGDLLPGIMKYFDEYGVKFFRGLDIWHIPQLKERLDEKN